MKDRIKIQTIGLMSTPNAGGTTFLVAASTGSVGHATRFHGSLFKFLFGYQLSTVRIRNMRMAMFTAGPSTNDTGFTHASAAIAASGATAFIPRSNVAPNVTSRTRLLLLSHDSTLGVSAREIGAGRDVAALGCSLKASADASAIASTNATRASMVPLKLLTGEMTQYLSTRVALFANWKFRWLTQFARGMALLKFALQYRSIGSLGYGTCGRMESTEFPASTHLTCQRGWRFSGCLATAGKHFHSRASSPSPMSHLPTQASCRISQVAPPNSVLRHFVVVVAATATSLGIGKDGKLPWRIRGDMSFFKRLTSETKVPGNRNAVIMGRKTWESIPNKFKPLSGRLNIVLSRHPESLRGQLPEQVAVATSLEEALAMVAPGGAHSEHVEDVFVIGGGSVYEDALRSIYCKQIVLTEVTPLQGTEEALGCDTFLPQIDQAIYHRVSESPEQIDDNFRYNIVRYERCAQNADVGTDARSARANPEHEEWQYLDLVRDIIETGIRRGDRTGTGTVSKFGVQMRFSLRDGRFPLLTTKKVFWRGLAEELLWFIQGNTNANKLAEKNVHIWDGNGSREFLDKRGLGHREVGDLGPVYGFQWRHFGAQYRDMHAEYAGEGIDQLKQIIDDLRSNPESRRHVLTAWNPVDLPKMALPPCHMMAQFYVANGELSCLLYQRSGDMGLGVPFNIASYALLTCIMAQVTGLQRGEFVHCIGDAHVYLNHIEPLKEQLVREPLPFPTLEINSKKTDIDSFEFSDFVIQNYQHHRGVKMDMAL